ncbi:MAG: AzlD domain-containing protein [Deltaproteobacteria bacterium]|nr:AzlD domain-containing protein [Deltaproteobacteria bacterium]
MIQTDYLFIVIGMGLVTYIPRWLPLLFLSRRGLPEWFTEWLDFIPAAILSALIFPLLVTTGEPRHLDLLRPELFVAIPTLIVALKTRSLAGTVIFGMFLYWIAGKFI